MATIPPTIARNANQSLRSRLSGQQPSNMNYADGGQQYRGFTSGGQVMPTKPTMLPNQAGMVGGDPSQLGGQRYPSQPQGQMQTTGGRIPNDQYMGGMGNERVSTQVVPQGMVGGDPSQLGGQRYPSQPQSNGAQNLTIADQYTGNPITSGGFIGGIGNQPTQGFTPMGRMMPSQPQAQGVPQGQGAPQGQSTPQYGLAGSESALQGALSGTLNMIQQGVQGGLGQLSGANNQMQGYLQQGNQYLQNSAMAGMGALGQAGQQGQGYLQSAMSGGMGALNRAGRQLSGAIDEGRGDVTQGRDAALGNIQQGFGQARQDIQGYNVGGQEALGQQAALSGAMGAEAQQAAMSQTMNSPEFEFLREQGLREVNANAAATGGTQGGEQLRDLTRFGQGLAAQRFDTAYNRLGSVADRGMNNATNMANLSARGGEASSQANQNAAQQLAGLQSTLGQGQAQLGQAGANLSGTIGNAQANLAGTIGTSQANLLGQMGANQANLSSTGAANSMNLGTTAASLISGGANSGASAILNTGGSVASGRTRAGEQIAGAAQATGDRMAGLAEKLGMDTSQMIQQYGLNVANQLANMGGIEALDEQQLATLIANLTTGQGSTIAGMQQNVGAAQAAGITGKANAINNTIGTATSAGIALSDRRLKYNIVKKSDYHGLPVYEWTWKKASGMVGSGFGFMADEVKKVLPNAVIRGDDGFDRVNYGEVFNGF